MGSTRVGGLVEIAAACMWLWQSQSGMNLEFPPAPIPAGPMPDIASLRPWQILPPGSRPRITLAADANTESSVGWELGYRTSRTEHSLVILRARDVRGGNSFERQTVTDAAEQIECGAWSRSTGQLRGIGSKTERVIYCRTSYIKSSTHLT